MIFGATKSFAWFLFINLAACAIAHGSCSVDLVIVKGRVEHPPHDARVRVQLIYAKDHAKDQVGDSTEAILESESFSIPIDFLTQSQKPVLMAFGEKCDRKPKTVRITLMDGEQEVDRVSLDFAKEFVRTDPSAYGLRSELVLHGSR